MDAKDYIINEYKELVYSIARKFNKIEWEDLIQAGNQGLIKAFNNYDETSDTKFSTYAYKYIYGEMYALISKNNYIKITKDTLSNYKLIMHAYQNLTQVYKREPSYSELSRVLNMSESLIYQTIMAVKDTMSLDSGIDEERQLKDIIPSQENISLDDKILLQQSIEMLADVEKDIINCRYYQDLTQSETAEKLGVSQVMVSRYEKKSIDKMRKYVRS